MEGEKAIFPLLTGLTIARHSNQSNQAVNTGVEKSLGARLEFEFSLSFKSVGKADARREGLQIELNEVAEPVENHHEKRLEPGF